MAFFLSPPLSLNQKLSQKQSYIPESSLSDLLSKYDVCGVAYLADHSAQPHVVHLGQITSKHRLVVSLGAHVDLMEEVLNGGAVHVAVAGDCVSSEVLAQFPKERILLEFHYRCWGRCGRLESSCITSD